MNTTGHYIQNTDKESKEQMNSLMQHLKQMKGKQIVIKSSFFFQKFDTYFFGE